MVVAANGGQWVLINAYNANKKCSCFVYFGDKRDKFVSEFSKHGVVMAKVQQMN